MTLYLAERDYPDIFLCFSYAWRPWIQTKIWYSLGDHCTVKGTAWRRDALFSQDAEREAECVWILFLSLDIDVAEHFFLRSLWRRVPSSCVAAWGGPTSRAFEKALHQSARRGPRVMYACLYERWLEDSYFRSFRSVQGLRRRRNRTPV